MDPVEHRPWTQPVPKRSDELGTTPVNLRQVLAYNMAAGRRGRGLTQKILAHRLAALTGKKWTVAAVSAAEAGWSSSPSVTRNFDVTDLTALSLALNLPMFWFFLPPPGTPTASPTEASEPVDIDEMWIEIGRPREAADPENPREVNVMSGRYLHWLSRDRGEAWQDDDVVSARLSALAEQEAEGFGAPGAVPSDSELGKGYQAGYQAGVLEGLRRGREAVSNLLDGGPQAENAKER